MTTLAELRQASLKEQKQKEQSNRPPEPAPDAPPVEAAPVMPPSAPVVQSYVAPPLNGNGHHTPPPADTPVAVPAPLPPAPGPETIKAERFFALVHESLSHKSVYPSGAKVSADMPSPLFHRAKRYCLDHGNVTLRQVLLDLLTAYLQEEGY